MIHREVPVLEDVREAALRPLARTGWSFWGLAALLALLVALGALAYVVQVLYGLGVAGYTDQSFWGIYEANLVSFIAVSYGGAVVSAILRLTEAKWRAPITRLAEATALFSLMVGMTFALIHVGRPDRIWRMMVTPQLASPIVWDFVVLTTYLVATAFFLYLPLIPDVAVLRARHSPRGGWRARLYGFLAVNWQGLPQQRHLLERRTLVMAIIIIPLAVFVHSVLSWAFALTGRPGWHSTIFAPYFVVGAIYSGIGMVILVVAGFRKGYALERYITLRHFRYLAYLMITLNLLYLYLTFTELLTEGYTMSKEAVPVIEAMLVGQYSYYFWLFILGGGILPVLLVALPWTRSIPGITIAAGFVVVTMWIKRLLIVVPAVTHPLISGPWGVFQLTWIPIAITIGAAAAIPLLLMFFFKFFPILAIGEMEEMAAETAMERAGVTAHAGSPL
jgi:Ni/Fe-hydrogenase subunit HybB-like protein